METMNDLMPLSPDHNAERLAQLKKLMPDLFTQEGKIDPYELQKIADPAGVHETERYEFKWFGKSNAKRNAFTPSNATLVLDEGRSVNPTQSGNLIIEGENLEVLKLLSGPYSNPGKIKCICIDPPYNTGKDFVYSDNYSQDRKGYWEDAGVTEEGVKIDTNTEADGRYHSNWLNMMYSRLLIARQLLSEDGVIFIFIDDNEAHHLRKLCDEVFGEENFVTNIVWQHSVQPKGYTDKFSVHHNHILCYQKSDLFKLSEMSRTDEHNLSYSNPDNDPNGEWRSGDVRNALYRPNLIYDIVTPSGKVIAPPSKGWRWSKETVKNKIQTGEIVFSAQEDRIIRKIYLKDQTGRAPETIWFAKEIGSTRDAANDLKDIFDGSVPFDTPKPIELIQRIVQLAGLEAEDIILDFFGGSGTTGQAITELNTTDNKNRKYILVQIPEATGEESEAFKAGYKRISDITIERNKRVVEKLVAEKKAKQPELFTDQNKAQSIEGLGFKVYKLTKSNFPRVEFAPDPGKTEAENLDLLKRYIADKEAQLVSAFNKDELTTEILLKEKFTLNFRAEPQPQFEKNEVVLASDGEKEAWLCLDVAIQPETVAYLKAHPHHKFICLERALDTTLKFNLKQALAEKFKAF